MTGWSAENRDNKNVFYKIIPCFNYIGKYPLFLFSETN